MTTDSLKAALDPCPFCGGKPLMRKDDDPGYPWYVTFEHDPECVMYAVPTDLFRAFATEAEAVAAWNRRASTDAAVVGDELKALIEAGIDEYSARCALRTEADGGFCHVYFYSDGQWRFQTGGNDITIGDKTVRCLLTKRLYAHPPVADAAVAGDCVRLAIETGHVVLNGRGTGLYDEALDAIRLLIAALSHPGPAESTAGIDRETAAWAWLDKKFGTENDDPVDRAYDASEMVDAFHAGFGHHPAPAEPVGLWEALKDAVEIAETLSGDVPLSIGARAKLGFARATLNQALATGNGGEGRS